MVLRDKVFLSMSSQDKEFAITFLQAARDQYLDIWAMYTPDGENRNTAGEKYIQKEKDAIKESCIFIMLYSKHSIESGEIKKEITILKQLNKNQYERDIKFLLISLDPDIHQTTDIIEEYADLFPSDLIFVTYKDLFTYDGELKLDNLKKKIFEIKELRYREILAIYDSYTEQVKHSFNLYDLKHEFMQKECYVRTVSEDALASSESDIDNMSEFHILTNEVMNYDYTTIPTMIISRNLLGPLVTHDGKKTYDPRRFGKRYYYYIPSNNDISIKDRLRSFMKRDIKSRNEVALWLIKLYIKQNNLLDKFERFNRKPLKIDYDDIDESMLDFLEFDDEDDQVIINIPSWFMDWIGDKWDYMITQIGLHRLDSLKKLKELYDTIIKTQEIDNELLKSVHKQLGYIIDFYLWQVESVAISNMRKRRLMIKFKPRRVGTSTKIDTSIFEDWLNSQDKDYNGCKACTDDMIDAALRNYRTFTIKPIDSIKLTYSFILFISKTNQKMSSWYTTASDSSSNVISYGDNQVVSRDEESIKLNMRVVSAFRQLIQSDRDIYECLIAEKSKILE